MEHFLTFFAFPLNLMLALLWLAGLALLWKHRPDSRIVKFLLSPFATILALVLLLACGLWIGFSGDRAFVQSIPFVLMLLYVLTVVYMVTLRGWRSRNGQVRWRFLFIHAGFLLAVGAAFWGSPDSSELRVKLVPDQEYVSAYKLDGSITALRYKLRLEDYSIDFNEEGKPVYYEAVVSVGDSDAKVITVNHPLSVSLGEDIYLASVSEGGCVLQIVREPWRYFALTGILMLLLGAFMLFIKGPKR